MFKRLYAVLICIAIIVTGIGQIGFSAAGDELASEDTILATELLQYIGVLDKNNDTDLQRSITRGEFATFLARLIKMDVKLEIEPQFKDSKGNPAIENLAAMGIFKGDGNGWFSPGDTIDRTEAIIAIVRMLCSADYFNHQLEYLNMARRLGIIEGQYVSGPMTMYDAIALLCNTAQTEFWNEISLPDGNSIYVGKGKTILDTHYSIYYTCGQITENPYTVLYSATQSPKAGHMQIAIDDVLYNVDSHKYNDYIGQTVKVYYKYFSDSKERELVCMTFDDDINEELVIEGGRISASSPTSITYSDDKDRTRKVALNNPSVIYNGRATAQMLETLMPSLIGNTDVVVKLYKSMGSTGYSVAIIEEYKNVAVTLADNERFILYTDGLGIVKQIDFSGLDNEHFYKKILTTGEGNEMSFSTLYAGDKLSVACSEDGNVVKAYFNNKAVVGSISKTRESGGYRYAEIDGKEYICDKGLNLQIGTAYTMVLDYKGRIAWADKATNEDKIGYLYAISNKDEIFSSDIRVRIFGVNKQFYEFKLRNKVNHDGVSKSAKQFYDDIAPGGVLNRQLITFKVNAKGEATGFESPLHIAFGETADGLSEYTSGFAELIKDSSMKTFGSIYPYNDSKTKVVVIPPEDESGFDNANFAISTMSILGGPLFYANDQSTSADYKVRLFKTDPTHPYVDYVLYQMATEPANPDPYMPIMCIDEICKTIAGDAVYTQIIGYTEHNRRNLYVEDGIDLQGIESGDIISYQTNAGGEIVKIWKLYDLSADLGGANPMISEWGTAYKWKQLRMGELDKVEFDPSTKTQAVLIVNHNNTKVDHVAMETAGFKFTVIDSTARENMVYIGDINDAVLAANREGKKAKLFLEGSDINHSQLFLYLY